MYKSTFFFTFSRFYFSLFFTFAFSFFTFSLAQKSTVVKIDSIQTTNSNLPTAPQAEEGDVKITDGTNTLIRITDEGTFGAIEIKTGVPSITTDKLYNDAGTLKFNGSALGAGVSKLDDLEDARTIAGSVFIGSHSGENDHGDSIGFPTFNTAVGVNSLQFTTTGHGNTANGSYALYSNTTGGYNVAIGVASLRDNTTGNNNVGLGYNANHHNHEGSKNTIIGYEAGKGTSTHNKTGNIFLGYQAGYNEISDNKLYVENSNSTSPLIWGDFATDSLRINGNFHVTGNITSDGNNLVATEINDLTDAKYDGSSLFIGEESGINDDAGASDGFGNQNTAVGKRALYLNTTGRANTAYGNSSLNSNTTGEFNTANGTNTLYSNTTGNQNTAIGYRALFSNTTGNQNTAIGYRALYSNTTGKTNTAIGDTALSSNTTGFNNTANGKSALKYNTIGHDNTANGQSALYSNIAGIDNEASGQSALFSNTTGSYNIGIGKGANYYNEGGFSNTIIGYNAGHGSTVHNKSGNIFIGYQAGYSETSDDKLYIENSNSTSPLIWGDFANDIAAINGKLGVGTQSPDAKLTVKAASSGEVPFRVKIGGGTKFKVEENGGVAIGINSSSTPANGLYVNGDILYNGAHNSTSDVRLKTNIEPINNAIKKIKNIRGVYYDWNRAKFPEREFTDEHQIGVLAQEVEKEFPELVRTGKDGYKSVDYTKLAPILIEAVKEQEASIKYQDMRIKKLEKENENLKIVINKNKNLRNEIIVIKATLNKLIKQQPEINVSKK